MWPIQIDLLEGLCQMVVSSFVMETSNGLDILLWEILNVS